MKTASFGRLAPVACLAMAGLMCSTHSDASTRTITITNAEDTGANDLHIDFTDKTSVTSNPFGNDRSSEPDSKDNNFWGLSVSPKPANPNKGQIDHVTLSFSSIAQDLTMANWWWTLGGDATTNGNMVGKTHKDTGGTELSFLNGPATGDGAILVTIDGMSNVFDTTAGFTAAQSASAFDGFLDALIGGGFSLINSTLASPTTDDLSATSWAIRRRSLLLAS